MAVFDVDDTEQDVIDKVRALYRSYIPEVDAWKKPSYHDVNSVVVGGIAWTALNEARNGIDARINASTAVGNDLDLLVAAPPLFLTRNNPTSSSGFIYITCDETATQSTFPLAYTFETAAGTSYVVTETTSLDVNGEALIPVSSVLTGTDQNSCEGQFFEMPDGCDAVSQGIFGGFDIESDSQLRRRYFAARAQCYPLGSAQWYETQVPAAIDGITRLWIIQDGGMAKVLFTMEDKYPCGNPEQIDIDALVEYFENECFTGLCFCPVFEGAKSGTISPEICWETPPEDIDIVTEAMETWLRANFELGQSVHTNQIQCFLTDSFPQYGGTIKCCEEFEADCDVVYNCVEILGPC